MGTVEIEVLIEREGSVGVIPPWRKVVVVRLLLEL